MLIFLKHGYEEISPTEFYIPSGNQNTTSMSASSSGGIWSNYSTKAGAQHLNSKSDKNPHDSDTLDESNVVKSSYLQVN